MKKIRNIVPLPLGGKVIEPGTVFEYDSYFKEYRASTHSFVGWVTNEQASDRRLFEPGEEAFIGLGNEYRAIDDLNAQATAPIEWTAAAVDKAWLEIGNCFRTDTNLNPAGVLIDDAVKVFKLALRVPHLWGTLVGMFQDPQGFTENQDYTEEFRIVAEIEAAAQPGDSK